MSIYNRLLPVVAITGSSIMVGCDGGGGSNGACGSYGSCAAAPVPSAGGVYEGTVQGTPVVAIIAENGDGRISAQDGTYYHLTVATQGADVSGSYFADSSGIAFPNGTQSTTGTVSATLHIPTTNAALVELVKQSALSPQMMSVFADEVAAESARASAQPQAAVASVKRAKEKAEKKIVNIVDAIATFGLRDQPELHGQLKAGTQERDAAVAELARLQSGRTRAPGAVTVQADDLRKILDALVAGDVHDPAVMVPREGAAGAARGPIRRLSAPDRGHGISRPTAPAARATARLDSPGLRRERDRSKCGSGGTLC